MIAILLPGHIRSYNYTHDNIHTKLIYPLTKAGYECRIYSSIWNNSGFRELGWNGDICTKQIKSDSFRIEFEEHNRQYFIDMYNNDRWRNYSSLSGPETCGDAASMWYKVWKSFQLIDGTPDIVFRIRPDIYFEQEFDLSAINDIKPNTVYMSNWHGKYESVTCQIMDHFGFGDFSSMKTYCSIFPNIPEIIQRNDCPCTAEGFLYSQLKHNNINISRLNLHYGVIRSHGFEKVA